ncbi:DNA polymerase I [Actinospica sp.]|uniref:DNA polymerase I n=1 Tax=Actinospica sp. TaxID=1872142 RepID=UPI002B507094|nr:DNA polymerase I [Actinospica sp.]HWG25706.1 DNA polymerase I [Actinospica sp.]
MATSAKPAGAGTTKKLLLLDGHSMAFRAYYALPPEKFTVAGGEQSTNAVYGFTSMLANVVRDEAPTHLAVCFDVSRAALKRTALYPEYKAQRAAAPDLFRGQVDLIAELMDALHVPVFRKEGSEADDLIATLATQAAAEGFDVAIVTGDRDALQLVTDQVTVLYPKKGVGDLTRFTPEAVEEKYALTPRQYPDFAALRGDPSDNLPSVPGVGEKTASKWIREYGSLDALLESVEEIKGKVGESLRANVDAVRRNRQLTELDRAVELDRGPADLERSDGDAEAVDRLFDTLQFRVLRPRIGEVFGLTVGAAEGEQPAPAGPGVDITGQLLATGQVAGWLAEHAAGLEPLGVAAKGRWGRGTGDVTALALATGEGPAAWLNPTELDPADENALRAWLGDASRPKVLHDAKGPLLALDARGLELRGLAVDTALAGYLVNPGQRGVELADLARQFLHRELGEAEEPTGQLSLESLAEEADGAKDAEQLMAQARAILDLGAVLQAKLAEVGEDRLLGEVELPLVELLARMERRGIAADRDYLGELEGMFAADVKHAIEEAHAAVGTQFNLGSPKQLQEVLFEQLALPTKGIKKTKTGYTTDADALQTLVQKATTDQQRAALAAILRHRDVSRLRSTVEGLIKTVGEDGRIHSSFNQMIAATGRLSSTDPNLQNIPVRTDEGRRIRKAFVAGPGYDSLLTADYSQIEMRVMAHLSGDEALIEAFNSGEDLHSSVASRVFGVSPNEVTGELRRRVKAVSYGLAYGQSAYGLANGLGITNAEATKIMEDYFARFGGVRDYLHQVVDQARQTGYTETLLGRRRYFPDLTSTNVPRRQMAERMALNAPIQGSAADIIKLAMLRVEAALGEAGLRSRLLLQVHDELVLELVDAEREQVEQLVRTEMAGAYELRVPLDVSVGVGKDWRAAGH